MNKAQIRLILICLLFAILLLLSIRYQPLHLNTGHLIQPRLKNN